MEKALNQPIFNFVNYYVAITFYRWTRNVALVVLLFFGGKKIPEMMKGLGKGVRSFKEGMKEIENDDDKDKTPKARN